MIVLTGHIPDPEGTGPQRRLCATVCSLAQRHHVDLMLVGTPYNQSVLHTLERFPLRSIFHIPPADQRGWTRWRMALARRCPSLFTALSGRPSDWPDTSWLARRAVARMQGRDFTRIHAFRLSMAPVALRLARQSPTRPVLHLDLDDLEARTHQRIADLADRNGDRPMTRRYRAAVIALRRLERQLLPRFSRIYVCSDADRVTLGLPGARVLPNSCTLPVIPPRSSPSKAYRALFLGSLGYYPNEDALRQIRTRLLPLLHGRGVEVLSAGFGGGSRLSALLASAPGFRHLGQVPKSADVFAQTDCMIAPLRAGGGTRLKILESFAHGRPVITTAMGIEGIAAQPEVHYLPAETPEDFARQILRLAAAPDLTAALTRNARNLIAHHYSPSAVDAALAS